MKNKKTTIGALALLFSSLAIGQTARVQVIHNSPDPAAETVDVRANGAMLIDDFKFRTSFGFADVPAGVDVVLTVNGEASADSTNPVFRKTVNFTPGETYVVVASGVVNTAGYNPATPFDLYVYAPGKEISSGLGSTNVLVFHGATDAPQVKAVKVSPDPIAEIIGASANFTYGAFSGNVELPTVDYALQVRTLDNTTVAEYSAPLNTLSLGGASITVVASGFLDPSKNNSGPAFGLWVAGPTTGNLIQLPTQAISTARVQVIHNSADAAAAMVDVRANGSVLVADDLQFRTAAGFIDVPAGVDLNLTINAPSSADSSGALFRKKVNLIGGKKYVVIANGIVSPTGYSPATPFDLYITDIGQESAGTGTNTDLLVFHGATDAPTVDVQEVKQNAGQIINDFSYGNFVGYAALPTADYSLQVRTQDQTTVAQYSAPLATLNLNGAAAVVVASGFLNPGNNSTGEAFGLWVALPSGGNLVQLPTEAISTARLQVIHNSADAAAAKVDLRANGSVLVADDLEFRTAEGFKDVPAGVDLYLTINAPTSNDSTGALFRKKVNLEGGKKYVAIANGIVSPSGYSPATPFDIYVTDIGQEASASSNNTDVLAFHGATDAPMVDVVEVKQGAGNIINNFSYGNFGGYLNLPTADYSLQVRTQDQTTVAQYSAPLATLNLNGAATVVVASGFLNPANNSGGAAFGLWVALPSGGNLVELPSEAISTARVQVIHNSADAAAATVDVRVNGDLAIDDFKFRTVDGFNDVPAGVDLYLTINAANSTDSSNAVFRKKLNLVGGEKYIVIANGIVSSTGYTPATPFDLYIKAGAKESAPNNSTVEALVFHGATDAPTVDVFESAVLNATAINDLSYGSFDGYAALPLNNYTLNVKDQTGTTTVASYGAPLQTLNLGGQALTILASGFLNTGANSNGADFGLWVALSTTGNLIQLPVTTGINDNTLASATSLYPNPSNDLINLNFTTSNSGNVNYTILDITGKAVKSISLGNIAAGNYVEQINVKDLAKGTYLLNLFVGEQVVRKKISVM